MRSLSVLAAAFVLTFLNTGCHRSGPGDFTDREKALIHEASEGRELASAVPSGTMRVLTIEDSLDLTVLRGISRDLSADALLSEEFAMLSRLWWRLSPTWVTVATIALTAWRTPPTAVRLQKGLY